MRIIKPLFVLLTTLFSSLKLARGETAIAFAGDSTEEPSFYDQTAGWQFTTLSPITVTSLGFYDGGSDGLVNPHPVAIWDNSGHLIVQSVVSPGTATRREGLFRYVDIPGTRLSSGVTYVIGSLFYEHDDDNYNGADLRASLTISSAIAPSSVKSRTYFLGKGIGFPPLIGGPIAYFGPNFQFTAAVDLVAIDLAWNGPDGGVDARYQVNGGALTEATTAKVFWATGTTIDNIIPGHDPITTEIIAPGTGGPGSNGVKSFHIQPQIFDSMIPSATHLVLFVNNNDKPSELKRDNNVAALKLACEDILGNGAMSPAEIREVKNPKEGEGRHAVIATLKPNFGLSLRAAARICGVDHFNFRQFITSAPADWIITTDTGVLKRLGQSNIPGGLLDPFPGYSLGHRVALGQPRKGCRPVLFNVPDYGRDDNESYWDDDKLPIVGNELFYVDAPMVPSACLDFTGSSGTRETLSFATELVAVNSNGGIATSYRGIIPNAYFTWRSDQTTSDGNLYLFNPFGPGPIPQADGGGIFDLRVENPMVKIGITVQSATVKLSWLDVGVKFQLEYATNVRGPWNTVQESITTTDRKFNISLDASDRLRLFRLRLIQ